MTGSAQADPSSETLTLAADFLCDGVSGCGVADTFSASIDLEGRGSDPDGDGATDVIDGTATIVLGRTPLPEVPIAFVRP